MGIYLGIDIGGSWIKFGTIDAEGHILLSDRVRTDASSPEGTLKVITGCADHVIEWAGSAGEAVTTIGIGSPGTINARSQKVQPPTPHLTTIIGVNLAEVVQRHTGLPTTVDNDANCAAWAEHQFGAGRGIDNLICVTVGSGIGSGCIIDGQIFSGPTGSGGEMGHVSVDCSGPLCPCGNRGCVELFSSATAMLKRANSAADDDPDGALAAVRQSNNGEISIASLFKLAGDGDDAAVEVLATASMQLGSALVSAINILDSEAIIIGGGVADADTDGRWVEAVSSVIHRYAFSKDGQTIPVGKAALGNDAGFIGAAALGARQTD